jgi:large subunit ribosomal protein L9
MEVILTSEVLGLGDPGEVVQVKNGYGRNYLIPQGMALEATKKNIKVVESEKKRILAGQNREAEKVRKEANKLAGVQVKVTARAGEGGKLFGSVTNMQIAAALAEQGHDIDRRRILMPEGPIKRLGNFTLRVKLHAQVLVDIELEVVADPNSIFQAPPPPVEAPAAEAAAEETEATEPEAEAETEDETEAAPEDEPKE